MNPPTQSIVISAPVEIVLYPSFGQYDETGFVPQSADDADALLRDFRSPRYSAWEVRRDFMCRDNPGADDFVAIYGRFAPDGFDFTLSTQRRLFRRWRSFVASLTRTPLLSWGTVRGQFPYFAGILDRPMDTFVELSKPQAENIFDAGPLVRISCRTALEAIIGSSNVR